MLCCLDDTVKSDGEELFANVHVARCVGGKQSCGDVVLIDHTVCDEVLMDALDELFQFIRTVGITHEAVHVDGDDLCTACNDATRTEGVAEGVVGKFVAEAAAGGKAIYAVRHIDKEAVSFLHLPCAVPHEFCVGETILRGEEAGGEHREGQEFLVTLPPKPLHEEDLQFTSGLHIDLCSVGVVKATEHFLHVGTVENADIPEHALISSGTGGLVECVDDAL